MIEQTAKARSLALAASVACVAVSACAGVTGVSPSAGLTPGAKYVALGSSYAAGPGIEPQEMPATRCTRSTANYAHQFAQLRNLMLVDVSCGGARTKDLLEPWKELPPQLDSVTPDTRLVTITIGGNDVGYIGYLVRASMCSAGGATSCNQPPPTEAAWEALAQSIRRVAAEVKQRAPNARVIFVNYVSVLPATGSCAAVGMTPALAEGNRAIARRLAEVTATAARDSGAELLDAATLSQAHDACSATPWIGGYAGPDGKMSRVPFHPNKDGMTAIAGALAGMK